MESDSWQIVATFELRLLSSRSTDDDEVKICKDRVFKKPSSHNGCGWPKCIPVRRLRSGWFIQDDTIKLRAHLTIQSLERLTNYSDISD